MIDVLAPLGLVFMAVFVVVFIRTARRQRRERSQPFRDLAAARGWRFLETDDGTAKRLADGFRDFAVFSSPSAGERDPENVVLGTVDEGRVCLFLHGTHEYAGHARLWSICLIEAREPLGPRLRIRRRGARRVRELGEDPEVSFDDAQFERHFEVRSPEPEAVRERLDTRTRDFMVERFRELPFEVEVQSRDRRIAAYPDGRNAGVGDAGELEQLLSFTRGLARRLAA